MIYKGNLKGLRVRQGLTQEDLANILKISRSAYAKKENQKTRFFVEEAIEISKVLGVSIEEIFLNN